MTDCGEVPTATDWPLLIGMLIGGFVLLVIGVAFARLEAREGARSTPLKRVHRYRRECECRDCDGEGDRP